MQERIRRLEQRAERAAGALEALADEPDMARIALVGVLCSLFVCWLAVAWGEPGVLLALPLVVVSAVAVARRHRRHVGEHLDVDIQPATAEVDEWLARLHSTPRESLPSDSAPFAAPLSLPTAPPAPVPVAAPGQDVAEPDVAKAVYEVREIRAGALILLEVRDGFENAVDTAFELIEERDPPELEIVVAVGEERNTVWSYKRAAADAEQPRGTLDLFGFDATRWQSRL